MAGRARGGGADDTKPGGVAPPAGEGQGGTGFAFVAPVATRVPRVSRTVGPDTRDACGHGRFRTP